MFRLEHTVTTDEIQEIELTKAELDKIKKIQSDKIDALVIEQAEAAAKAHERSALLAKLGITEEEAALLLGGN